MHNQDTIQFTSLDFKKTAYSVSDFLSFQKQGTLSLNPTFQRRSVWKKGAKSFLIDTILRGLPIPVIILREKKTDLRTLKLEKEVVDGQQRIRTVLSFVDPTCLDDFDLERDDFSIIKSHNPNFAGKKFAELPEELQQRILDYEFSVHVLPTKVSDKEVLEIFSRMNATGEKLNPQELRNAEYYGAFKTLAYNLASQQLDRWAEWQIFTKDEIARMDAEEWISEFIIFCMEGIRSKEQKHIDQTYKKYEETLENSEEITKRIQCTFDTIDNLLGNNIAKTEFSKKTIFYSLFVSVYHLLFGVGSSLQHKKAATISKKDIGDKLSSINLKFKENALDQEVLAAIKKGTTGTGARKVVVNFILKDLGHTLP